VKEVGHGGEKKKELGGWFFKSPVAPEDIIPMDYNTFSLPSLIFLWNVWKKRG